MPSGTGAGPSFTATFSPDTTQQVPNTGRNSAMDRNYGLDAASPVNTPTQSQSPLAQQRQQHASSISSPRSMGSTFASVSARQRHSTYAQYDDRDGEYERVLAPLPAHAHARDYACARGGRREGDGALSPVSVASRAGSVGARSGCMGRVRDREMSFAFGRDDAYYGGNGRVRDGASSPFFNATSTSPSPRSQTRLSQSPGPCYRSYTYTPPISFNKNIYPSPATTQRSSPCTTSTTVSGEPRRRNEAEREAFLRNDPLLSKVEPDRVFCSLCCKWVRLRQDSTFCAHPWVQHREKCLVR